jgi:glycosyltransferase involved in cell wall biosynthesis
VRPSTSRPIRVALFATSVAFGGIERVVLNLLRHMPPGVEIVPIVFTRTDCEDQTFFERLREMGLPHETLYVNSHTPALIVNPVVNLAQAIRIVKNGRFDLIHSHGYRADAFVLVVAKYLGLPFVSTVHGFTPTDPRLRLWCELDARLLRFFPRVMAVSAPMKDQLVAYGLDAARVDVVINAVEEAAQSGSSRKEMRLRLGISESEFVFGFVGRLSDEKGVDHLLQAAESLVAQERSARFVIVGDGPRKDDLLEATRSRGLEGKVDFVGFQSNTAPWYETFDAFVLPSLSEGTPMALLEAMAHGLPSVATAVGGVPQVVSDGENGLLVPSADRTKLCDAMRSLMTNAQLRAKLSEGAVELVRGSYGVDAWIEHVQDVYAKALDNVSRS